MKIIVHGQMELFATNWEIQVLKSSGVSTIVSAVSQIAQIQTHREDVRLPFCGVPIMQEQKSTDRYQTYRSHHTSGMRILWP